MKKIEAIIRSSKLQEIKDALHEIDIDFFSYYDTTGVGNEKNKKGSYRGASYDTEFISRKTLSIVVRDINLQKTIDCLMKTAYTGEIGDGRIFIYECLDTYRIRTKEKGDDTLFDIK